LKHFQNALRNYAFQVIDQYTSDLELGPYADIILAIFLTVFQFPVGGEGSTLLFSFKKRSKTTDNQQDYDLLTFLYDSSDYSAFVARIFHHFTGQQDPWPPVATSTNPFDSPPRDNMPAQPPTEYFGQPERVTGHQAEPNTNFLQKKIPIFNPPNLDSQPK
jgi:hypothetical protein